MYGKLHFLCLVAACSSSASPPPGDPCDPKPVIDGGSAELGRGSPFVPIVEGQDLELELGAQGLWMFVLSTRTRDMDLGSDDRRGVLELSATDQAGALVSLELGCRVRSFEDAGDGAMQLTTPFYLPMQDDIAPQLDGSRVTLHLEVRDDAGRRATLQRVVVARMPARVP